MTFKRKGRKRCKFLIRFLVCIRHLVCICLILVAAGAPGTVRSLFSPPVSPPMKKTLTTLVRAR